MHLGAGVHGQLRDEQRLVLGDEGADALQPLLALLVEGVAEGGGDDADEQNGALQVIPKTHFRLLKDEEIAEIREISERKSCPVRQGGVHLLKPLTLHASSKTENGRHRRVIHLEFNNRELPGELAWAEREEV